MTIENAPGDAGAPVTELRGPSPSGSPVVAREPAAAEVGRHLGGPTTTLDRAPRADEPGTPVPAWSLVAAAATAARDEIAMVLAAGLHAPGALDGLGRASSTIAWVQERLATGVAVPGDGMAMADVLAARRSVDEARALVASALALGVGSAAAQGAPTTH